MKRLALPSLLLFFVACQQAPTDTPRVDDASWQNTISADVEPCTNGDCPPDPPPCTNGDCPPDPPACTNGDCPAPGGGKVKVEVCHRNKDGSFNLITIGEPGFDAHILHGDAVPGDPVPEMPGYLFDDACVPVLAITCPCFDKAELDAVDWGTGNVYLTDGGGYTALGDISGDFGVDTSAGGYCEVMRANHDIVQLNTTMEKALVCRALLYEKAIELGCPEGGGICTG